jgi:hypothetical protein
MTSWRDGTSPETQDDLDGLLDAALPFAQQQIETHGEFFPYGVALDSDGTLGMLAGDPDGSEQPASLDVLAVLFDGLRSQRDQLRAIAVVSDVRLADSDAIRVELEHREGPAMAVFLPYRRSPILEGFEFGDLSAAPADRQVWSA